MTTDTTTPTPLDMPQTSGVDWANDQSDRQLLLDLIERVDVLQASHEEILRNVTALLEQVQPMIEKLSTSPIIKMLGVK